MKTLIRRPPKKAAPEKGLCKIDSDYKCFKKSQNLFITFVKYLIHNQLQATLLNLESKGLKLDFFIYLRSHICIPVRHLIKGLSNVVHTKKRNTVKTRLPVAQTRYPYLTIF